MSPRPTRWSRNPRSRPAARWLLAAALGLGVSAAAREKKLADWSDTEVRYLLGEDERKAFDALGTDPEREEFISRFWALRDPDPATPGNELRAQVEKRTEEANRMFRAEGRTGWSTDRGRIYILFGPPDESVEEAPGTVIEQGRSIAEPGGFGSRRSTTRGIIVWTYHRVVDRDLPPNTAFRFEADSSGSYRLTSEPNPEWTNFSHFARVPGQSPTTGLVAPPPGAGKGVQAGQDKGKGLEAEAMTRVRALLRQADEAPAPSGIVIDAVALVFPTGTGKILVVVPFRLPDTAAAAESRELLAAVLAAGDGTFLHAASMPFERAAGEAGKVRSFVLTVEPGAYRVALAVRAAGADAALGATRFPLEVPSFDGVSLKLSSVLLARGIEMRGAEAVRLNTVVDGIAVGNVLVDATPGNDVPANSMPEAFFFVSGARMDPNGALGLTASYRILAGETEKRAFPPQRVEGLVNAQPIPIGGLAPGSYRLEIKLEDAGAAASLTESVPFRVQ